MAETKTKAFLLVFKKRMQSQAERTLLHRSQLIIQYSILYTVSYLTFLIIAMTFFDSATPIDVRLLSPIYPSFLILIMIGVGILLNSKGHTSNPKWAVLVLCLIFGIPFYRGFMQVSHAYENGVGYLTKSWLQSDLMEKIGGLPPETTIFSNKHEQLQVILNRDISRMPRLIYNERVNGNYDHEFQDMLNRLEESDGLLVVFTNISDSEKRHHNLKFVINHPSLTIIDESTGGMICKFNYSGNQMDDSAQANDSQ